MLTDGGSYLTLTIDGDVGSSIRLQNIGNASSVGVDDFRFA